MVPRSLLSTQKHQMMYSHVPRQVKFFSVHVRLLFGHVNRLFGHPLRHFIGQSTSHLWHLDMLDFDIKTLDFHVRTLVTVGWLSAFILLWWLIYHGGCTTEHDLDANLPRTSSLTIRVFETNVLNS